MINTSTVTRKLAVLTVDFGVGHRQTFAAENKHITPWPRDDAMGLNCGNREHNRNLCLTQPDVPVITTLVLSPLLRRPMWKLCLSRQENDEVADANISICYSIKFNDLKNIYLGNSYLRNYRVQSVVLSPEKDGCSYEVYSVQHILRLNKTF